MFPSYYTRARETRETRLNMKKKEPNSINRKKGTPEGVPPATRAPPPPGKAWLTSVANISWKLSQTFSRALKGEVVLCFDQPLSEPGGDDRPLNQGKSSLRTYICLRLSVDRLYGFRPEGEIFLPPNKNGTHDRWPRGG